MPRTSCLLTSIPVLALLALGCSTAPATADGGVSVDAPRTVLDLGVRCTWDAAFPDAGLPAGDPGAPGPFAVGVRTLTLVDESRARTLPIEIWYPVDPVSSGGEPNAYNLDLSARTRLASACTMARRDAPAAPGPLRPVAIFSHGFGGIRFQSYFLTEHLASHGIVVIAPDHPTNTFADVALLGDEMVAAQSAIDRPLDVLFVLDHVADGYFDAIAPLDAARVAVAGHSFGGWTAIESARRDPRLSVVVSLAPGFRYGVVPSITTELARPLLLVGGTVDGTTPFDTNQQPAYDAALPPRALARIIGAGHMDFTDLCSIALIRSLVDDGCDPLSIDPEIVHARVRTLVLAFLRTHLEGDPIWQSYLDPARMLVPPDTELSYDPGPP